MSLLSSIATFVMGTKEIFKSFGLMNGRRLEENLVGELLGGIIGGIDLYLVGIALLIFGYGVYELIISPIEPARSADGLGNGLLDIRNLDQLKEKLVKVLVVALIVSAFKAMMTLPIDSPTSLLLFSLSVLLLALSGWLVARTWAILVNASSLTTGAGAGRSDRLHRAVIGIKQHAKNGDVGMILCPADFAVEMQSLLLREGHLNADTIPFLARNTRPQCQSHAAWAQIHDVGIVLCLVAADCHLRPGEWACGGVAELLA